MARARSAGAGKVVATIAIATGLSIVPPTACTARAAISQPMPGARPHSSEPRPKTARPIWNDALAAVPVGGGPGQHQETGQHQRVGVDRPLQAGHRWRAGRVRIDGSATVTIEMSITTTTMLAQQIASTSSAGAAEFGLNSSCTD